MNTELILIVVTIFALGIVSQILADKYRIPSIIFLLTAGILAGPEFLGIIDPDAFGEGLQLVVGLAVAIIVFEGAFHLKIDKLRAAQAEAVKLGTIGAIISFILTATAAYYFLGVSWSVGFLIGALLIATGPTVIKPILEVVPVRKRVEAALETEGIVNDVTAAILALVVFEFVVVSSQPADSIVTHFFTRLGSGLLVGVLVSAVAWYLLTKVDLNSPNEVQDARIIVVGAALISYGFAELIISEAGIAAVATAGMILGNLDVPHKKAIKEFEDTITVLVLSFVFITLTALLSFEDLLSLGIGGLLFVLAVTLVIRPLTVYASTKGNRFTSREKAYISLVGPRGIIPASVATLFALELQSIGQTETAATLVGAVFLVIFATSFVEGGLARHIAEKLDVIPMNIIIVGAGEAGISLAQKLEEKGENIVIIENNSLEAEKARNKGFNVYKGDARNVRVLKEAGAENAKIIAAVTHDDDVNLVVSQMAKSKFNTEKIIARVNDPENREAFKDLQIHHISSPEAIADAMDNTIENPALWKQLTEQEGGMEIKEIKVTSSEVSGESIKSFEELLPEGCTITLLTRNNKTISPENTTKIEIGDRLTIIGRKKSVEKAADNFHPS